MQIIKPRIIQMLPWARVLTLLNSYGYAGYGNLLEWQNRLSEMVQLYQKVIRNNPNAPNIIGLHYSLGDVRSDKLC